MKKNIVSAAIFFVGVIAPLAAQQNPATPAKPKAKKTAPVQAITIPKDAVKDGDHYRWTDRSGKVWFYRQTPFGVTRVSENDFKQLQAVQTASPGAPSNSQVVTTAVEHGDEIAFERISPFGPTRWTKKKTDLTPDEQKIWEESRAKAAVNNPGENR